MKHRLHVTLLLAPLDANSDLLKTRYTNLGGSMQRIIPQDPGHNLWPGCFQCEELLACVKTHCKP